MFIIDFVIVINIGFFCWKMFWFYYEEIMKEKLLWFFVYDMCFVVMEVYLDYVGIIIVFEIVNIVYLNY